MILLLSKGIWDLGNTAARDSSRTDLKGLIEKLPSCETSNPYGKFPFPLSPHVELHRRAHFYLERIPLENIPTRKNFPQVPSSLYKTRAILCVNNVFSSYSVITEPKH